jgi:thiosulfate/3-mercaptopyruvate sulfurtransferase
MSAARAWWLLRYYGHTDVSVLDGGLAAWTAAGYEVTPEPVLAEPGDFVARPGAVSVLTAQDAAAVAARGVLLDARARSASEENGSQSTQSPVISPEPRTYRPR